MTTATATQTRNTKTTTDLPHILCGVCGVATVPALAVRHPSGMFVCGPCADAIDAGRLTDDENDEEVRF